MMTIRMRIAVVSWMTITSIMRSMLMTVFARMLFIAWRSRRLLMLIKSAAYHLRWFDIQWIRIFVIAVVGVGCAWVECTIGFTYSDNVTHDFRFLFSSQLGLVYVCVCVCVRRPWTFMLTTVEEENKKNAIVLGDGRLICCDFEVLEFW